MGSSEDFQTGICSGGWWNPRRSLFSDFMWSSSYIVDMDEQAEMKQASAAAAAAAACSRSDDSDDHHSSSAEHFPVMSPDYAQLFQDVQKPPMADFGVSDWLQNSLLHDSSNMLIFKPADDDQKKNNNSLGFYNLDQFDTTTKVSQMGLYAYTEMLQNLAGQNTDKNYVFDNNFVASDATNFTQQLNPGTKHGNNPAPFWDSWMSSDELGAPESSQLLVPAMFEDQRPQSHSGNGFSSRSLMTHKINSKAVSHKLADSALSGTKRKNTSDELYKSPRIETLNTSLPTFKVRKEKLGDRITALQQLVSPFGKTDTASVLHEAVEYIKFLHDQVSVLRAPYMQNGTPTNQHQQMQGESSADLRSRGLCLVPISSTFPVANESTGDFWTPTTFGAPMTFR